MNTPIMPNIIETVAKTLTSELGLPAAEVAAAEQNIQQLFLAQLGTAMIEAMSPDDRLTYQTEYVDTQRYNSPEAQAFINNVLPDLETLLTAEAKKFIDAFHSSN